MKSLIILLIFILIIFISYKYSYYNFNKNKSEVIVKQLLLPTSFSDYFKFNNNNLQQTYENMFSESKRDLNLLQSESTYNLKKKSLIIPQRFFIKF